MTKKKILLVIIGNGLDFKNHINELCKKASQQIAALPRLSNYLHNSEKKNNFQLNNKVTI